jgi:hypothetical protein
VRSRVTIVVGLSLLAAYATGYPTPMTDGSSSAATRSPSAARTLYAVPTSFSFDDLSPTRSETLEEEEPVAAPVPPKPKRLPRPPAKRVRSDTDHLVGTPQAVLVAAYRKAVAEAPRTCKIRVSLLAAIGQIESGSVGGRGITSEHVVSPPVYGPLLDGGPFATIRDTDDGSIDGDAEWDRAVGPMQFIPGTWRWAGADGDEDGSADPQNVFDAAKAAALYLCRGDRDLSQPADLRAAIWSYNQSSDYLSATLAWMSYFEEVGVGSLATDAIPVRSGGRASDLGGPKKDPTSTPTSTASRTPRPTTTSSTTSAPNPTTTTGATTTTTTTTPEPSTTTPSTTTTNTPSTTSTTTQQGETSTDTPTERPTITIPCHC